MYSDPVGARWVHDGKPLPFDLCEKWLQVTANNYVNRGYGMFTLEDRASKEILGFCGLVHPNNQDDAEVKYVIARAHWGKGLASEILPQLVSYGVARHGLERIIATIAPENTASQRVLLKSGFVLEREKMDDSGGTQFYAWHAETHPEASDETREET